MRKKQAKFDFVELIKSGALIASLLYGIGFIAVASFTQKLRIVDYSFINIKYFYAGFYYIIVLVWMSLPGIVWYLFPDYPKLDRTRYLRTSIVTTAALDIFFVVLSQYQAYENYLLTTLSDIFFVKVGEIFILSSSIPLFLTIIVAQVCFIENIKNSMLKKPTVLGNFLKKGWVFVIPVLFFLSIVPFGTSLYPIYELSNRGKSPNTFIVTQPEIEELFYSTGLQFNDHISSPVFLLDKTGDIYYFLLSNGQILSISSDNIFAILQNPID